jgi:hypothetical protein
MLRYRVATSTAKANLLLCMHSTYLLEGDEESFCMSMKKVRQHLRAAIAKPKSIKSAAETECW